MFSPFRLITLLIAESVLIVFSSATVSAAPDEIPKEQGMLERMMHPDRSRQSTFQGKVFNAKGSPYDKSFAIKDYSGAREYGSHSYETKGFVSGMKSWLGDHLFPQKKLSGNLEKANPDAAKKFDSKDFKTKNFTDLDKTSLYSSKGDFPTQNISLKGKTQGALDNNPHLEDAIRKGLSIDDVRKLLNKGP
ncbi:MAG: hypothetical protein WCR44_02570 [Verrucomicrobiota bacterium]